MAEQDSEFAACELEMLEMQSLIEAEQADDDLEPVTPRVNLTAVFESLDFAGDPLGDQLPSASSCGWSLHDLGGDGLDLLEAFSTEPAGAPSCPAASDAKTTTSLGFVKWEELCDMHPNKVFGLILEFIMAKLPKSMRTCKRVRLTKKTSRSRRTEFASLAKDPMHDLKYQLNTRDRSAALYTMCAWISRLSGRSVREVRKEMNQQWVVEGRWKAYDDKVKCRYHFLRLLEKEPCFQEHFPELCSVRVPGRSSQASLARVAESATEPQPHTACHGYLATYNTDLGLRDPTVLQWVQQGLRGDDLAAKLQDHDLLKEAFRRFAHFHQVLAEKVGFRSWAVAMEHSANGDHPARVHMHVYAGVSVVGGHLFMGYPKPKLIDKDTLLWEGCAAPFVKFTVIRRPSPATILNGVASGMYYVAGAKKSNLFLEASAYPFKDRARHDRLERFCSRSRSQCGAVTPCLVTPSYPCTPCRESPVAVRPGQIVFAFISLHDAVAMQRRRR
jgi:hypothetical protein